jgi:hypothetical protein
MSAIRCCLEPALLLAAQAQFPPQPVNAVAADTKPLVLQFRLHPPYAIGFPALPMHCPDRYLQSLIGLLACTGFAVEPGVKATA